MGTGPDRTQQIRQCAIAFTALALVAFFSAGAALRFSKHSTRKPEASNPVVDSGLMPAPDRLNFGEVWESNTFTWTLPIENTLDRDVRIEDFSTSCNCTQIEPRSLLIPAGKRREVRLVLDLTAAKSKVPDAEWRDFQVTIYPTLQGVRKAGWNVTGRIHTAIRLEQPTVDFGRCSEAAQPLEKQVAYVKSFVPLDRIDYETTCPQLQVKVAQTRDDPRRFEIVIAPSRLSKGPITERVYLIPQLADNERLPPKSISVTGRIVSDFQASPSEALFGGRRVGDIVEETLTLYSLTNASFEVVGRKINAEALTLEDKDKPGVSKSRSFRLQQRIEKAGPQEGYVIFRLRTTSGKETTVEVRVSYLGVASSRNSPP